jgi:hypothetical protein
MFSEASNRYLYKHNMPTSLCYTHPTMPDNKTNTLNPIVTSYAPGQLTSCFPPYCSQLHQSLGHNQHL